MSGDDCRNRVSDWRTRAEYHPLGGGNSKNADRRMKTQPMAPARFAVKQLLNRSGDCGIDSSDSEKATLTVHQSRP
jgi:hypothetical protein